MNVGDGLRKNLEFWHWLPRLLCEGLTEEQLHWQPEGNPNHITFALWHAYRSEDEIIHMLLGRGPSLFRREDWGERLPVAETGDTRFGNGLNREQIASIRLPLDAVMDYAEAVGRAVQEHAGGMSLEEGAQMVPTPFFTHTYPMLDQMSKAEIISFFSIGHVAEHLGEVQYIKGLMGLQGAPM
jgi:hypothetical protein